MEKVFGDTWYEHIVLRAGWDNVVTMCTEVSKARTSYLDKQAFYMLSPVIYRSEGFGVIIQKNTNTYYFNKAAASVLSTLLRPASLADILAAVKQSNLDDERIPEDTVLDFINSCIENGLIEQCPYGAPSKARLLFTEVSNFPSDRYYRPIGVEVEVTNKCYRKCTYCAYESGPNPRIKRDEELTFDEWIEIFDNLAGEGVLAIEFTGGDPFAREDALELIEYVDQKGIALYVNSDLSILNDSHLDKLSRLANLVAVQTSLDGASPESCEYTRGKGSFKTLLRQMDKLRSANLPVSVGTTVHHRNFHEIAAIANIVGGYGAKFYIGPMYPAGRGANLGGQIASEKQWQIAVAHFMDAVRNGIVEPADSFWSIIVQETQQGNNPARDQVYLTHRGNRFLRIDPRGSVYITAKLRQWHPRFWTLGNLTETSLATLWEGSSLLQELRTYAPNPNPFDGLDVRNMETEAIPAEIL